jgi:1-deoxy-D-xylulose-5-phosphate reductoisomerase
LLVDLAVEFNPRYVAVMSSAIAERLQSALMNTECESTVLCGSEAFVSLVQQEAVDIVVAGIVGKAGLESTLAAAQAGKQVLLANKESMVIAGSFFREAMRTAGARIIPIDSEHNAIFQALPQDVQETSPIVQTHCQSRGVDSLVLTASGGPFLKFSHEELQQVTPEQACKHPNWSMGAKVSVDSASLMNKGLELIEACYVFGVQESFIDVVIHPQSIVHSMVTYVDGSTLAHLSAPNMEVPIAHGLAFPERRGSSVSPLRWDKALTLEFLPLNIEQFPCFSLARQAMRDGEQNGTASTAVLNAANEVAVAAFLERKIAFLDIPRLVEASLERYSATHTSDLASILALDLEVRQYARHFSVKSQRSGSQKEFYGF